MINTSVLIVGAGPTGLLLANLLGKMKISTIVLERNKTTVDQPRAVSIDDESMRMIQAIGLSESFSKMIQTGYGSIYKGPSGKTFATVKPMLKEYGFEKRNAFQQPELESLLRKGLSRFSCIRLFFQTKLIGLTQNSKTVTTTAIRVNRVRKNISAKYLVACDGGRSTVRKILNISSQGSSFKEPWLIVDLKSTKNRQFHTEVFCNPQRPCITLPGPNGIRRYEFKLHKHETLKLVKQKKFVRSLLAQFGPDKNQTIDRIQAYTFHARTAEKWRSGRVFLAGDAAHLTPPFAGQGLNIGLRDVYNLAWKLSEALAVKSNTLPTSISTHLPVNHLPTNHLPTKLLDSYEQERKPHAISMIKLAQRMGRVMMPHSKLYGTLIRSLFYCLGFCPPIRDYFVQMRYKPKPRFKTGLIWKSETNSLKTIIGQLLPQPLVELPNGKSLLLDEILPDQPIILIYSERPEEQISVDLQNRFHRLGTAIVGLTPEWTKAQTGPFPTARDQNRLLSKKPYLNYLNHALLIRRDKYIASTAPAANLISLIHLIPNLRPSISTALDKITVTDQISDLKIDELNYKYRSK